MAARDMRIRTRIALALGSLAIPTLVACGGGETLPTAAPGMCNVVVDVTGYPGHEWSTKTLQAGWEELKVRCADRVITANAITDHSKSNQCIKPKVNTDPGPSDQDVTKKRLREEAWAQFGGKLEEMINCEVFGPGGDPATSDKVDFEGSDIFGAVQTSAEWMNGVPAPHTIFVLSDMMNTMPPMRTPPKRDVDEAIASLKEASEIPDLSGAQVYVVGSGTKDELSPKENAKLTDFWRAYFESAGAESVSFTQAVG